MAPLLVVQRVVSSRVAAQFMLQYICSLQVDIINRHEETMKEMEKLLAAEFPALQVSNMASLQVKGQMNANFSSMQFYRET